MGAKLYIGLSLAVVVSLSLLLLFFIDPFVPEWGNRRIIKLDDRKSCMTNRDQKYAEEDCPCGTCGTGGLKRCIKGPPPNPFNI